MIELAAKHGYVDRQRIIQETLLSIRRAVRPTVGRFAVLAPGCIPPYGGLGDAFRSGLLD